jgi:hypothetical protein
MAQHPIDKSWHGIRQAIFSAAADPDADPVQIKSPVAWGETAAGALGAILPDQSAIDLVDAAAAWIAPAAERAAAIGVSSTLAQDLNALLARRGGAPGAEIWRGELGLAPKFILNPNAFDDDGVFDATAFGDAAALAVTTLTVISPGARRLSIGITDLHLFLARLGLDYESAPARDTAAALAALITARADAASARFLAGGAAPGYATDTTAKLPAACPVPGLLDAVAAARSRSAAAGRRRHEFVTGCVLDPRVESLLGAETISIAPALSALTADGALAAWARAKLNATGQTLESALAAQIAGADPLRPARPAAHAAMHDAIAPFVHTMPDRPSTAVPYLRRTTREKLPARRAGYTQKAAIAGHKIFISTGEYADGRLGEVFITPHKENSAFRGLMDAFAIAVSMGLQHGVNLEDFVDAFTQTRFGAAGAVEGDPAVLSATSSIDYVFRNLAANYLNINLAPAEPEPADTATGAAPQLPLDLPDPAPRDRRRTLKLVS